MSIRYFTVAIRIISNIRLNYDIRFNVFHVQQFSDQLSMRLLSQPRFDSAAALSSRTASNLWPCSCIVWQTIAPGKLGIVSPIECSRETVNEAVLVRDASIESQVAGGSA